MEQAGTGSDQACHRCGLCPPEAPASGGLAGWRMAAWAAGAFLMPVALAIAGAALAGPAPLGRLLGACAGLVLGAAGAATAGKIVRARGRERGGS